MPYGSVPDPNYVNYLGTNDPTIRPPTAAEQAAAAAEAQRKRDEAYRTSQDALARQQAAQAREDALARDRTSSSQFEETRSDANALTAQKKADRDRIMAALLGTGTPGGGAGGGVGALESIAGGSGGSGGGGGTAGVAAPTAAAPTIASGPSTDDLAAEQGARTASKENAGLRLRAGLRGLHGVMAARGIAGSGAEAAGTADLFAGSNMEEANTDRAIISARAKRAGEIADRNAANATTQAGYANQASIAGAGNATSLQIAQMNAAAADRNRISNLLLQFGMSY